jgi:hypothetical protein
MEQFPDHEPAQAESTIGDTTKAIMSPPKTHCTFAVHTGLSDAPELPPEMRLEVYEKAFPDMDRCFRFFRVDEAGYSQPVCISQDSRCWIKCAIGDDEKKFRQKQYPVEDGICTCPACERRQKDNQRKALTSNFARDPAIRDEFLAEYLSKV